jgi:DNA topoisomerase VI subunit B
MKSKRKNQLVRATLQTSRLLDFFTEKELTAQTAHAKGDWLLVILKELLDNSLDACEDASIPPKITVTADQKGITVTDNGPGIPADTVAGVLDFTVLVSSREHYVSPTRGAQGNALKTILAIPFVLDGKAGRVDIIAHGTRHEIIIGADRISQEPRVGHRQHLDRLVKNGTRVEVHWPVSASSLLEAARHRFLQTADDYTFLNPHLSLAVEWFGERTEVDATDPNWKKWLPSDPTSAHWYGEEHLDRLIAGYITDDERRGKERTVREFVAEFSSLTGTAKQRAVLEKTGLARMSLSALRNGDGLDRDKVQSLLDAMKAHARPIKPAALGVIGRDHLANRLRQLGCEMETFAYRKATGDKDDVPWILETAFAASAAAFDPSADAQRRLISGVNWSPAVAANPFRQLGHESLDAILREQRAGSGEPVVFVLHLACPQVSYTDRGKSAVVIDGGAPGDQQAGDL